MGIQNATARKLAVPDLTTTVLTLTITGVAADSAIAGGAGSVAGRRLVAVTAMFWARWPARRSPCTFTSSPHSPIALIVTAAVALVSWRAGTTNPSWVNPG